MAATLPPPCGEAGAERAPPLTDHRDGRTRCLRGTPQDGPSRASGAAPPARSLGRCSPAASGLTPQDGPCRASGAAPPAGSLGRCSPAPSSLTLQDPGLARRLLALPGPEHHVAAEPAHSFVLPLEMLVTKRLFRFLTWVKCGAQG